MNNSLESKLKTLSGDRQTKIKSRALELISREATLAELRKALEFTQAEISEKLHINQEAVSRMEKRSDLLLSTLQNYIKAMGGELVLSAKFPDQEPINLMGFYDISPKNPHVDLR
jgi:transcriptional regulator with XRE-family HTH domain